ncbi:MAG: type IV fimbrial biogenesis protein FimT [Halieaceae bacterium]|jgi:type IV fimbrial biogenesis protein FimT
MLGRDKVKHLKIDSRGFTIIELMVVLVIVAVLATIAGPSFKDSIERNRRLSTMEQAVAILNHARTEAVSRSAQVRVCPSTDSDACRLGSNDWTPGVIAFVDDGGATGCATAGDGLWDNTDDPPCEAGIRVVSSFSSTINVYGPDPNSPLESAIIFNPDGGAEQLGSIRFCNDDNNENRASAIIVGVSGQLRIALDSSGNGVVEDNTGDIACE